MRNVAGHRYGYAVVATVVGLSLCVAAPAVMAGTPVASPATTGGGQASAVVDATIGGIATGKPRLRFAIETHGGFPVTAVTIALPAGLSFSPKAADLDHGVRVGSDRPHSNVRKGHLTVTLRLARTSFVLTIAGSALTESQRLEDAVRKVVLYNQAHMSHQRTLPLKLLVTMAGADNATLGVTNTIPFR
jgi:hypothetical protein